MPSSLRRAGAGPLSAASKCAATWSTCSSSRNACGLGVHAAAVFVEGGAAAGGEVCKHGFGIDGLGVAVGGRRLHNDRRQPTLPEIPERTELVADSGQVRGDEPEDDVPGVRKAEEVVFPGGVRPLGTLSRRTEQPVPATVRRPRDGPAHRVRLRDRPERDGFSHVPKGLCSARFAGALALRRVRGHEWMW